MEVRRVIFEPTAASLAYCLNKNKGVKSVVVIDLGGGTSDVSVLWLQGGTFVTQAMAGNNRLGGQDFNDRIQKHMLSVRICQHISETGSTTELLKMTVLIVGAALLGSKQKSVLITAISLKKRRIEDAKFVDGITALDSDVQGGVMTAVQTVMKGSEKRDISTPISPEEVLPDKPGSVASSSICDELGSHRASLSKEISFLRDFRDRVHGEFHVFEDLAEQKYCQMMEEKQLRRSHLVWLNWKAIRVKSTIM